MTAPREELLALITAAYRYAGVVDAGRLARAFADSGAMRAIPGCPACGAAGTETAWTGGMPHGGESWRCTSCGNRWDTKPEET